MQYSVQFFTWTAREGVHLKGPTVDIRASNPRLAAINLLGLKLDDHGPSRNLAARVWSAGDDEHSTCECFYYH